MMWKNWGSSRGKEWINERATEQAKLKTEDLPDQETFLVSFMLLAFRWFSYLARDAQALRWDSSVSDLTRKKRHTRWRIWVAGAQMNFVLENARSLLGERIIPVVWKEISNARARIDCAVGTLQRDYHAVCNCVFHNQITKSPLDWQQGQQIGTDNILI